MKKTKKFHHVNTIYSYRLCVKNYSDLPREEFEAAVMKIGMSWHAKVEGN
jgi:hypothetical protein